jgi:predicted ATPase
MLSSKIGDKLMATTYEPGTRVMHNDDSTQGTVLDWNTDKGFGTVKFDLC